LIDLVRGDHPINLQRIGRFSIVSDELLRSVNCPDRHRISPASRLPIVVARSGR
jgi:hypothetical protein